MVPVPSVLVGLGALVMPSTNRSQCGVPRSQCLGCLTRVGPSAQGVPTPTDAGTFCLGAQCSGVLTSGSQYLMPRGVHKMIPSS